MEQLIAELVSVTGVAAGTAWKVFDFVMAGASMWTILALIGSGGGIIGLSGAALYWYVKRTAERLGGAAFVSW